MQKTEVLTSRNMRLSSIIRWMNEEDKKAGIQTSIDWEEARHILDNSDVAVWYTIEAGRTDCITQLRKLFAGSSCPAVVCLTGPEELELDFIIHTGLVGWNIPLHICRRIASVPLHIDVLMPAVRSLRGDYSIPLPSGSVLHSRSNTYSDLKVFAAGGTSICYRGVDENGSKVLIKEVYPVALNKSLGRRGQELVPVSDMPALREILDAQIISALREAVEQSAREKEQEKELNNKGFEFFERYRDFFYANNTCYTVYYDYGQGTLAELVGKLNVREAVVMTARILEHLEALHGQDEQGYLHLDISPENILMGTIVDNVRSLKFIDLGSMMRRGDIATAEAFPCKDGYSPYELTGASTSAELRDQIGPATDTFAVGAVLYNLLTGRRVSWSVCRQGGEIIRPDDPALQLTYGRRIGVHSEEVLLEGGEPCVLPTVTSDWSAGVSLRVLEALNRFLGRALTNNPAGRFQTAKEMRLYIYHTLLPEIDQGENYFDRMEMPEDFMRRAVEMEDELLLCGRKSFFMDILTDIGDESADPERMRKMLEENSGLILRRPTLRQSREEVRSYLRRYGRQYDEILFIDESDCDCELFNGKFAGRHLNVRALENDDRTLLVFCGREEPVTNGIVEMVDEGNGMPVSSLSFMLQKGGAQPHVIRILPSRGAKMVRKLSEFGWLPMALPAVLMFLCIFLNRQAIAEWFNDMTLPAVGQLLPMLGVLAVGTAAFAFVWKRVRSHMLPSACLVFSASGFLAALAGWSGLLPSGLWTRTESLLFFAAAFFAAWFGWKNDKDAEEDVRLPERSGLRFATGVCIPWLSWFLMHGWFCDMVEAIRQVFDISDPVWLSAIEVFLIFPILLGILLCAELLFEISVELQQGEENRLSYAVAWQRELRDTLQTKTEK